MNHYISILNWWAVKKEAGAKLRFSVGDMSMCEMGLALPAFFFFNKKSSMLPCLNASVSLPFPPIYCFKLLFIQILITISAWQLFKLIIRSEIRSLCTIFNILSVINLLTQCTWPLLPWATFLNLKLWEDWNLLMRTDQWVINLSVDSVRGKVGYD